MRRAKLLLAAILLLLAAPAAAQQCGTVSNCPNASVPLSGAELLYIIQQGVSKRITVANLNSVAVPNTPAQGFLFTQGASLPPGVLGPAPNSFPGWNASGQVTTYGLPAITPSLPNTVEGFFTLTTTAAAGAMTMGGATLTNADVGKLLFCTGMGPNEGNYSGTIASVSSATSLIVSPAPTQSMTNVSQRCAYGSDQYSNLQNAFTAGQTSGVGSFTPGGIYLVSKPLVCLPPSNYNNLGAAPPLCAGDPGAVIIAMSPMTSLLTWGSTSFAGYLRNATVSGFTLDANFLAVFAADYPSYLSMNRTRQTTKNALLGDVRGGNLNSQPSTGGMIDYGDNITRDITYVAVSGVSNANPPVVTTSWDHGFATGRSVSFTSVPNPTITAAGSGYGTSLTGTLTWSGAGCSVNPVLFATSNSSGQINFVSLAGQAACTTWPSSTATTWTPGGGLSAGSGAEINLGMAMLGTEGPYTITVLSHNTFSLNNANTTTWGSFTSANVSLNIPNAPIPNPITLITNANPGVVTTANPHGLVNGQQACVYNATGILVDGPYTVAGATTNTFQLSGVDTTLLGTYTANGVVLPCYINTTFSISSITNANPGVVTTATAHGFVNGELVCVYDATGMNIAGMFTTASVTTSTFRLSGFNTSTLGTYTGGGFVQPCYLKGIYYENATDEEIFGDQGYGFLYGVYSNLANGAFDEKMQFHWYNYYEQGPIFAGYSAGGDNSVMGGQIDCPAIFGYQFTSGRNDLHGSRVNCSGFAFLPNNQSSFVRLEAGASVNIYGGGDKGQAQANVLGTVSAKGFFNTAGVAGYAQYGFSPFDVTYTQPDTTQNQNLYVLNSATNAVIYAVSTFASGQATVGAYDTNTNHVGAYLASGLNNANINVVNNAGTFLATAINFDSSGDTSIAHNLSVASGALKIAGSSTGVTSIGSLNASATNYTINFPAASGTVVLSGGAVTSVTAGASGALTISPTTGAVVADCTQATSSQIGCVEPNGTTISVAAGVISVNQGANYTWSGTNNFSGTFQIGGTTVALPISGANGGTGVANSGKTITIGANLTTTGAGATTLAFGASTNTQTFPTASATLAGLAVVQTWSAAQTFNNADLLLAGATSGTTTLEASATASGVITLPAVTDTVAVLGTNQTFTATETFNGSIVGSANIVMTGSVGSVGSSSQTVKASTSATASQGAIQAFNSAASQLGLQLGSGFSGGAATISLWTAAAFTQNSMSFTSGQVQVNQTLNLASVTTGTNADFLCLAAGGNVLIQSSACTISSRRFKIDRGRLADSEAFADVMALRSVKFQMRPEYSDSRDPNSRAEQIGLFAEDVAAVDRRAALFENDMRTPKSYRDTAILGMLVGFDHEIAARFEALQKQFDDYRRSHP